VSTVNEIIHQRQSEVSHGILKFECDKADVKWHMVMYVIHDDFTDYMHFM
jgi:hypothetical protein